MKKHQKHLRVIFYSKIIYIAAVLRNAKCYRRFTRIRLYLGESCIQNNCDWRLIYCFRIDSETQTNTWILQFPSLFVKGRRKIKKLFKRKLNFCRMRYKLFFWNQKNNFFKIMILHYLQPKKEHGILNDLLQMHKNNVHIFLKIWQILFIFKIPFFHEHNALYILFSASENW